MSRVDALQVFVSVAETRSFTAAARQLGLTPSAVSKQISQLEARLGTRLLIRTTRSVSVTEAGEMFHERAHRILEELKEAESVGVRARRRAPGSAEARRRATLRPRDPGAQIPRVHGAFSRSAHGCDPRQRCSGTDPPRARSRHSSRAAAGIASGVAPYREGAPIAVRIVQLSRARRHAK